MLVGIKKYGEFYGLTFSIRGCENQNVACLFKGGESGSSHLETNMCDFDGI